MTEPKHSRPRLVATPLSDADGAATDVLAGDYDEALVDEELVALGADPDAVAARGRSFVSALQAAPRKALCFPSWVRDGAVLLAAAASDASEDVLEVELGHGLLAPVTLRLEPRWNADAPGMLVVSWAVEAHHPAGWELQLHRPSAARPVVVPLGDEPSGTRIVTADELGFDPVREPFGFVFAACP